MDIVAHVIFDEGKALLPDQVSDILNPSSQEVVHADHGMSRLQQRVGEMTPEKPRSACNQDTHMTLLLRFSRCECHENSRS
ncbi:MAG: hypothetical protein JW395_3113 [Nitrospira sp.]|nr:hypothetical protein [Nitrospira sp.]